MKALKSAGLTHPPIRYPAVEIAGDPNVTGQGIAEAHDDFAGWAELAPSALRRRVGIGAGGGRRGSEFHCDRGVVECAIGRGCVARDRKPFPSRLAELHILPDHCVEAKLFEEFSDVPERLPRIASATVVECWQNAHAEIVPDAIGEQADRFEQLLDTIDREEARRIARIAAIYPR